MKVMNYKAVVLSVLAGLLAAGGAQAGITKVGRVYSGAKPADKPYQMVHVGSEVGNGMGNAVYVAFFATRADDPGNTAPRLDRSNVLQPAPNTEEGFAYDITGYPAFLRIPDSANDASQTQLWAFPACAPYTLPSSKERQDFLTAVSELEDEGPISSNWDASTWTAFLQPLHGMDYSASRGELVGGLTFLGKVLRWNLNSPGTMASASGVCNPDSLAVGQITRSRLIKYSPDSAKVIAALRGNEEDIHDPDALLELKKFSPDLVDGATNLLNSSVAPVIPNATSGHAIYVTPHATYTGGSGFRRITLNNGTPDDIVDFSFASGSAPIKPVSFLNMVVQENASGEPTRIYALNSRDWDPDELMTVPDDPDASTLAAYQSAFATAAAAFGAGLYIYDVSAYDPVNQEYVLTKVTDIPAVQPVELVLDGNRLFFNDRIGQEIVEVDVALPIPARAGAQATECLSSNLIKGAGNTLYLTSIWSEQLYSVGGTLSGAACNAVEKYSYTTN
ncbi:MAG: hypothetical protein KER_00301 [Kerstersia gyiorum]|uniref:hypothetical protein n=1 Tax=Kerstersia gyiorum TaxID=206506 RepID=UPI0030CCE223